MNRIEKALQNHKKGYNCSQSVACAFCDEVGIDEKTMFSLTEGFGLGMGDMQGTCGAISGAVIILSLKNSCANPNEPNSKANTYKIIKQLTTRFREKNGSELCHELKGSNNNGKPLRPCSGCIEDAVTILEEILQNE